MYNINNNLIYIKIFLYSIFNLELLSFFQEPVSWRPEYTLQYEIEKPSTRCSFTIITLTYSKDIIDLDPRLPISRINILSFLVMLPYPDD